MIACLLLAKGHETTQMVGTETLPFDDAAVARSALAFLPQGGHHDHLLECLRFSTNHQMAHGIIPCPPRHLTALTLTIARWMTQDYLSRLVALRMMGMTLGALSASHSALVQQADDKSAASQLCVSNSLQALHDLAKAAMAQTSAHKIAVTGSVGKTSTKRCACACPILLWGMPCKPRQLQ